MQNLQLEAAWELWTRRFLQWAFGSVLVAVALIAFTRFLMPSVELLACVQLSEPWIGFWGNIAGGMIGLGGALVAAFAAVKAVDRQLNAQTTEARKREQEGVREITRQLLRHRETIVHYVEDCLTALQQGNALLGVSKLSSIKVFFPDLNDTLLGTVAVFHPTTAFRIRSVQFGLTLVKDLIDRVSQLSGQAHKEDIGYKRKLAAVAVRSSLVARILCSSIGELCETLEAMFNEFRSDLKDHRYKLQALDNRFAGEVERLKKQQKDLGGGEDE